VSPRDGAHRAAAARSGRDPARGAGVDANLALFVIAGLMLTAWTWGSERVVRRLSL